MVRPWLSTARSDGLADPQGGIGGELVTEAGDSNNLSRAHETDIAFLDEIEEGHAAILVYYPGVMDDEARKFARMRLLFGVRAILNLIPEFRNNFWRKNITMIFEAFARSETAFHTFGEADFFLGCKQRDTPRFIDIEAYAVVTIHQLEILFFTLSNNMAIWILKRKLFYPRITSG